VGVTLIEGALQALSVASNLEEARSKLGQQSIKKLGFAHWTEGESHRMDTAVAQLGDDLRAMRKLFPKKVGGDITKFFYMFKGCVRLERKNSLGMNVIMLKQKLQSIVTSFPRFRHRTLELMLQVVIHPTKVIFSYPCPPQNDRTHVWYAR
jgi:hypothetical protein